MRANFQVYGSVVIGQNYIVKKRRKEEYEAQQKAVSQRSLAGI